MFFRIHVFQGPRFFRLQVFQGPGPGFRSSLMLHEKTFCFKRLSNIKTQVVLFILKLLIKLVYSFISQNTKKSQFYQNSTLFLVNFSENSEQSYQSPGKCYQRRPVKLLHDFAPSD